MLMKKPSQLPISGVEEAIGSIGTGFLVTFSVCVGSLDDGRS